MFISLLKRAEAYCSINQFTVFQSSMIFISLLQCLSHYCGVHQLTMVFMVVVAFSSRARILGECSTIHSPPALFFVLFL